MPASTLVEITKLIAPELLKEADLAKPIVQIPGRLPPELWQRLDAESILLKESRNTVVVMALEFFFQRHEPQVDTQRLLPMKG